MSYEGYDVWYCRNGHRLYHEASLPFRDQPKELCEVCGEPPFVFDSVDLTNGCYCSSLSEEELKKHGQCPAHETVKIVLGWDNVKCPSCKGGHFQKLVATWSWKACPECYSKKKVCHRCRDRGIIPIPEKLVEVECRQCHGSGVIQVERWDISHLIERLRKQEEYYKELKKKHFMMVSAHEAKEKGCLKELLIEFSCSEDEIEQILRDNWNFDLSEEQARKLGFK